jgi:hypothetical protein
MLTMPGIEMAVPVPCVVTKQIEISWHIRRNLRREISGERETCRFGKCAACLSQIIG